MTDNKQSTLAHTENVKGERGKKAYRTPKLTYYGDVRTVTLAPTPSDATESGYTGPRRNPGAPPAPPGP